MLLFMILWMSAAHANEESIPLSYLALGDSYTCGEGVSRDQSFPYLLSEAIYKMEGQVVKPHVIAQTGWRSDELIEAIRGEKEIGKKCFDLITVLIGVNNQYQGKDIASFEKDLRILLQLSLDLACTKEKSILMLSIPDYGYTPFGQKSGKAQSISKELQAFNQSIQDFSKVNNIEWVELTDLSKKALGRKDYLTQDELHPSKVQYQDWVEQRIFPKWNEKVFPLMEKKNR